MALKRICKGCNKLIDYSLKRCAECQVKYDEQQKAMHKEYDKNRIGTKEYDFYKTKEWVSQSNYIRSKYNGLCLYSLLVDKQIIYVDCVHHIVELKENWEFRLNEDNLIPLCNSVHQMVHSTYNKGQKEKKEMQELLRKLKDMWESGNVW